MGSCAQTNRIQCLPKQQFQFPPNAEKVNPTAADVSAPDKDTPRPISAAKRCRSYLYRREIKARHTIDGKVTGPTPAFRVLPGLHRRDDAGATAFHSPNKPGP